jgi:hypothetical protein
LFEVLYIKVPFSYTNKLALPVLKGPQNVNPEASAASNRIVSLDPAATLAEKSPEKK